jgi:hypothetical protein
MDNLFKLLFIFILIYLILTTLTSFILSRRLNQMKQELNGHAKKKRPTINERAKRIASSIKKLIFVSLVLLVNVIIFGTIYYVIRRFNLL